MAKNKKLTIIAIFSVIIIGFYLLLNTLIGNERFSSLFSGIKPEHKQIIKKYIFPYKVISEQQIRLDLKIKQVDDREDSIADKKKTIKSLLLKLEEFTKESGIELPLSRSEVKLSNGKILEKYKIDKGFYYGINIVQPGSGFIDFHENNIVILSGRGILAYRKDLYDDGINFKQIQTNLDDFIGIKQFKKHEWFSFKDILVWNNQIYISFTEEIKEDCWNTSIVKGSLNYQNITFEKFFSQKECIHSKDNIDKEFNAHQSGGRMLPFDKDHMLFSVGEYRSRHLAQNLDSVNGKIIKINIKDQSYEIISMGHRNPQGLYYDKASNFILESEHGPKGGGELNLIELKNLSSDEIPNYGWPVVSGGEHYGGKVPANKTKYEKYPLYKSHTEHGFIEPLKDFTPSIGCSEIVKIGQNKYVLSSMGKDYLHLKSPGKESLYFFELNDQKKLAKFEQVNVTERVRDLKYKDGKLYLFLEGTGSIGVIDLN